MSKPIISVIIPVYKTPEDYLKKCIESIQTQSIKEYQIILVDDGSPDNCGEICEKYASTDRNILVLHQQNAGPSSARNNGLLHVKGTYLTFVDSDDILLSNAWEKAIKLLDSDNLDCLVFGWINNESGKPQFQQVANDYHVITGEEAMTEIAGDNIKCGGGYPWNKIWRTQAILNSHNGEMPLFNENLFAYEDKQWTLVALTGLKKVGLSPDVFYDYRFYPNSLTNNDESWYRRQFNAYRAYDEICNYLYNVCKPAYRKAIEMYFKFCFIDLKNMYSYRQNDMDRFKKTKLELWNICKRIRPGDLSKIKYNIAWIFILLFGWM